MNDKNQGFTVIELLVVVAIISVLAAVLYPVIFTAQKTSKKVVCISNLRQCGVALLMYMNDYATNIPPEDSVARNLLSKMPTCCPNDKEWTNGCTQTFGAPMIGSYAYIRSVPGVDKLPYEKLEWYFSLPPEAYMSTKQPVLMADIFHGLYKAPSPYYAWKETSTEYSKRIVETINSTGNTDLNYCMPDVMYLLCDDGHIATVKHARNTDLGSLQETFSWSSVFNLVNNMSGHR